MIKEKKSLKVSRSPSRRKFFKTAAATGVAAVALSAPAVAKERVCKPYVHLYYCIPRGINL